MSCDQLMEMMQMEPTIFDVSLTETQLNASQTEVTVKVLCDIKWSAKLSDSSWGEIKETVFSEGNTGIVVIGLGFNEGKDTRSNVITVTAGTKTASLAIDQGGLADLIKPSSLQIRGTEAATLDFKPGVNWTLSSDTEWIALPERTSGLAGVDVSLSVSAKEEFVDVGTREGALTFTFDGKHTVSVPVTQYQTDAVILEATKLEANSKAQTVSVKVDYNTDYTVTTDATWIHRQDPVPTKALNVGEEYFSIDANPTSKARTAEVVFAGGEGGKVTAKLTIVQEGHDPILDITTIGLFGVSGMDVQIQPNSMQASRTLNGDGTYTYRIIEFNDLYICEVTGLPVVQEDESKCSLRLTITKAGASYMDRSSECLLVGQTDELRWYRVVGDSAYFIIPNTIK